MKHFIQVTVIYEDGQTIIRLVNTNKISTIQPDDNGHTSIKLDDGRVMIVQETMAQIIEELEALAN